MRLALAAAALAASVACSGSGLFRQYEYEEEMYLSLDGTATIYVNASINALNALRGTSFDVTPNALVDRDAVRAFFTTPVTHVVSSINTSRRSNRRFVHVRIDVDDVRRLGGARPFAWSSYGFRQDGNVYQFQQAIGPAAGGPPDPKWTGAELVAFRLHVPSKIRFHNAGEGNLRRGNILVWEQSLTDRLRGAPLALDARMDVQSILYRTLWLFAATFAAVVVLFVLVIWWVFRRGRPAPGAADAYRPKPGARPSAT